MTEKKYARDEIRSGRVNILISTGTLESVFRIQDMDAFINYDFPENFNDYLFRLKNIED